MQQQRSSTEGIPYAAILERTGELSNGEGKGGLFLVTPGDVLYCHSGLKILDKGLRVVDSWQTVFFFSIHLYQEDIVGLCDADGNGSI